VETGAAGGNLYVPRAGLNHRSREEVDVGDHLVTAIQVCTNQAQDVNDRKLKGVRLWGRRPGASGTWGAEVAVSFERPHCRIWAPKVFCLTDYYGTGLRAYYVSERKGFSGLALRCTKLKL
jgi:hypothetical protein